MQCPKCGHEQPEQLDECLRCGIIFAKLREAPTGAEIPGDDDYFQDQTASEWEQGPERYSEHISYQAFDDDEDDVLAPSSITKMGWISLGVGVGIALMLSASSFLNFILHPLITMVHELGHSIFAWLAGIPTIPAFDFNEGGGYAIHLHSKPSYLLITVLYGLLGYGIYMYREHRPGLFFFSGLTIIYTVYFFTSLDNVIVLFMGHGTELLFAGIFLYRGISGWGCVHSAEQPLYAGLGIWIIINRLNFTWKLLHDRGEQFLYKQGKAFCANDFVLISEHYLRTTRLQPVLTFFLLCCLITPLISFLIYRYRKYIHEGLVILFVRE
ncbi:hypothetical protein ACFL27_21155 [candidate division CSSED10-310 bacterium]|uniref:M50 family peptidase n=1 Tax=candidate division CSSED10-310 bacterium TaxID=2855610 RepID=A0ABV6Z2Q2_UNCC1